jgi:hypothetical protein
VSERQCVWGYIYIYREREIERGREREMDLEFLAHVHALDSLGMPHLLGILIYIYINI